MRSSSAKLRAAGAVILGKTNLSEWANFRSTKSTSGWSGRGGQVKQSVCARSQSVRIELGNRRRGRREPGGGRGRHRDRRIDRVPVGRERDSSASSRPSVSSAAPGIIPISHTQDTAGPMARTVADAAILLGGNGGRRSGGPGDCRGARPAHAATTRPR